MIRTIRATRYVLPLREGGSLPAIVEGDDLGLYVVKFRGAGQGVLALIAELIAGEIGRTGWKHNSSPGRPVKRVTSADLAKRFERYFSQGRQSPRITARLQRPCLG